MRPASRRDLGTSPSRPPGRQQHAEGVAASRLSGTQQVAGADRAAAFKPHAGAVVIAQARDPYFVTTRRFTPGNFRLVAAGWLSSNLDNYVLAFALGALMVGLLTHVVVKSYGART